MKFFNRLILLSCLLFTIKSIAQPTVGMTTFFTNTTTALQANTACFTPKTTTVSGWIFSVSSTSNCGWNWTNTTGGDGRIQHLVGFGTLIQSSFESDDGSEFSLQNLTWGVSTSSWVTKPMTFVGYKNGLPVSGATLNATTPAATGILNTVVITFTGNTAFGDVDKVVLAPNSTTCNSILFYEDITIGAPVGSCTTPTLNLIGQNNVLCNGGSSGSASMTAAGGGPFTYTWIPSGGNGATASGLSAGIYTCAVTNSCGSTDTQTVLITQLSSVSTSTAATNALCNGLAGSATVTASGGLPAYTYSWSNGATTPVASSLLAGTYTVRVTDVNNCTSTKSVTITQPSALVTSTAITNALCNGANGSATLSASGGTSPYTYTWSSGPTTSVESSLLAGTYTVKVTDANNCASTRSVSITQPSSLVSSTAVTNASCNGGNGSATITASGGTGAYTYTWSAGPTTSVVPTLLAGTYSVMVKDANNCSSTKNVTIAQPSAILAVTGFTNVSCNGGSTASASVVATGGNAPYTYTWSTASTASLISGLTAGSYTVRAIDANLCSSATATINISQPAPVIVTTTVTGILCNGGATSATAMATGGTGAYTYSWSNSATASVTSLSAGVFTVTVADANNCTGASTVNVTQPSALQTAAAVTSVLCNGANGSATITPTGGTGPYSYTWSTAANSSVAALFAGIHTSTVTDNNGCVSVATVQLTQPPALSVSISVNNASCNGGANGSATVTAGGGTPAYSYSWSNTSNTPVITALVAGVYSVTVTDGNNCTTSTSVIITQPSPLVTSISVTSVQCNGGTGGATVAASGGTGPYSYLWSNASASPVLSSAPAANYTITVTDAHNCVKVSSVTISQPPVLVTTIAATNVLCNGGNGSATVTASGGTGAYTYAWTNSSTASVTTLPAGVHSVTVTDANACSRVTTITINQPPALVTSTAVSQVACNGGNGTATVSASGGAGPYTYLWSTSATSSVVSLPVGTYTATITDANGCNVTANINVTQPPVLASTQSVSAVLCNGLANGSATVVATGGTPGYSYLWSNAATGSVVTGLAAGVYSVTVTDTHSCTITTSAIIAQPAVLITSTAVTNVLCNGGVGSATVTASGGTSPYVYAWSAGSTSSVLPSALAGTYTITVHDANNCVSIKSVTVSQPAALVTFTTVTNVLCNGGNGTATVTASGGTGAYTYLWSNNTTASVVILPAGMHSVTVTDANACTHNATVNISQPPALSTATAVTNVFCNGGNGTATLTTTGGTGAYAYLWSSNATTSVASLPAGVHTATVTDANGCTNSVTVTLTQPTALSSSTVVTNVLCNGAATGAASVIASGGTPAYTYSWSTASTTSLISNQVAGIKTVTVTDANGCITTNTAVITQPPASVLSSTAVTNVLCFGDASGSATVVASGGVPGYTYLWSNLATTSVISNQTAGAITVTVTDANGCSTSNTVTIAQPSSGLTTSTGISNVLCFGGATGSGTVIATGGTPSYSYLWSTAATTSFITNEAAGIKTVTVTDSHGCNATATLSITQPPLLVTSTNAVNVLCKNGATGSATVTATGGTPAYNYLWSTGATSSVIATEFAGIKTVTVTDANNCSTTATITLTEPAIALTATSISAPVLCYGTAGGSGTVIAAGGVGTYQYLWSSAATTSVITGESAGIITVTVTDSNLCTAVNTLVITQPAAPLSAAKSTTNVTCIAKGRAALSATGGTAPYTYSWTGGGGNSAASNSLAAGNYSVFISDSNNCSITSTFIIGSDTTRPGVSLGTDVSINSGETHQFAPVYTGAITFSWSPANYLSSISIADPVVNAPVGEYAFILLVTGTNGCIASDTVKLKVLITDLVIANYMSPNSDGANDTWKVNAPALIQNYSVEIIDSFGKTVFMKDKNYDNEFDGSQSGHQLPDGVYYYFIKDGNSVKYKGSITLTR